jgi:Mn2+/Fe2+ NRAMP family transporter
MARGRWRNGNDPSGIATYSVASAQLGTKLLWTALLMWPLMAAVQMMCARIGKVTGQGLAGILKRKFPSWLIYVFAIALLVANTINIAADLAGMGDAAEMLSGLNSRWFVVAFARYCVSQYAGQALAGPGSIGPNFVTTSTSRTAAMWRTFSGVRKPAS